MKNYPDFSGVTRIRLLRLLGFLRRHRLFHTAHALEKDTSVFFDLQHVTRLVMKDQWEAAARYVSAFVPVQNPSKEVSSLRRGMFMNFVVQNIAFGGEQGDRFASMYAPNNSDAKKFAQQQRDKSPSEWEKMRHQTVAVLNSLVPRTPELKDKLQFSCHLTRLSDMVTVGLPEFRRRRSYKGGRVSKLNVALLRKRLRSIHERNQSGLTRNTGSVCSPLDFEMEQTSSLSACSSDYPTQKAEAAASNLVQASNPGLLSIHGTALPQSEELSAAIQHHTSHTPILRNTDHHASVMRVCLTRLLCYLKQSGFCDTAHALERDTGLFFDKWYMEEMVAKFQWNEASNYLSAFIPDRNCSKEASNLLYSMHRLKKNFKPSKVFEKSRASCWKELGCTTVTSLNNLVPRTPELKDKLQLPHYKTKLSKTIPLGLRAYKRHCWRRVSNMPAHALAQFILQNRLRSGKRKNNSEFPRNVASRTVGLRKPDSAASASASLQGVSRGPVLHPMLPTFPTSRRSEMSTLASNSGNSSSVPCAFDPRKEIERLQISGESGGDTM